MNHKGFLRLAGVLMLIHCAGEAAAQSGGVYDLSWWSVDAGGKLAQGGPYKLASTIGQPDSGKSTGFTYELSGGFLQAADVFPLPVTVSRFALE